MTLISKCCDDVYIMTVKFSYDFVKISEITDKVRLQSKKGESYMENVIIHLAELTEH